MFSSHRQSLDQVVRLKDESNPTTSNLRECIVVHSGDVDVAQDICPLDGDPGIRGH